MRLNVKKVTIVFGIVLFLWLMITYGSSIEVPRSASSKNVAQEIDNRIERLQKQMDEQMADSNKLLDRVKNYLVINHDKNMNVEREEENIKDLEVLQSKCGLLFYFPTVYSTTTC